jgi:1-acyl-sn-glycerol-3-phosphate acyltransferase
MVEERLRRAPSRDMSTRYRLFRWFVVILGRLLFGFTVHGAEKVPPRGSLIVAANHRRYADPVLICMAVPRRIQWMGKKELFVFPFKRFFYFIGTFPVDRQKGGRAAIRAALGLLKAGWALGIFPEGTRRKVLDVDHAAPKSGVGMLAARAGAPVLPVFVGRIPGLFERLRGGKLRVYVGDPINPDNTMSGGRVYREVSGEVLRSIYGLGGEEPRGAAS